MIGRSSANDWKNKTWSLQDFNRININFHPREFFGKFIGSGTIWVIVLRNNESNDIEKKIKIIP